MPLSRRTAGWRTTEGTPICPSYPDTQHKAWTTQDYREQITPCLDMYFTQAGKATVWTTKWEPCIWVCLFLPTFYLCCKTTRSKLLRLGVQGLLLPLKLPSLCSFYAFSLTSSSFLSCYFYSFKPDSFLYSN